MYKYYKLGQLDQMKVCIKTVIIYLENIVKNPDE
jgi:hypothetical protein